MHSPKKKNKILLYMSFALLFFAFWSLLGLFFVSFTPIQSDLFCIFSQQGGMHCYALFKLTLYLTLVLRLYFSFNETPVKWNKNLLISWALLLLFWTCINIVSGSINMKTYVEPNQYPICTISFDMFLPALWASLDLTAAIVNSYLFISPIYALHKQMETVDETDDSALKYVAIKQGVLSLIACFTTLTTMITVALFALEPLTVGTDVNVSTMSILLSYDYSYIYIYIYTQFCYSETYIILVYKWNDVF
eukprot:151588_1